VTLRRRVTLLVAALLLASAAAIGVVSAELARRTGLRELDASLQATIDAIAPADDPTSALFERVDALDQPLVAELFFDDADPVRLVEAFDGESPLDLAGVADESIVAAESRAIAVDGALRIRAVSLGDGQWLVVGVSARAVEDQWADTVRLALAAAVVVALAAAAVAGLVVGRALRPVSEATAAARRISEGRLDEPLPAGGAGEIGELTDALRGMVASLRTAAESHAASEARMRDFLGDVSHELRTPLTVVTGYADILAGGRPTTDDQRERALSRIRGESARMRGLIEDLLLLAEMDAVEVRLDETVDLAELVREHVGDLAAQQPARPIEVACEPVVVRGSRNHLARLLANLTSNVARHTDQSARLVVRLAPDATPPARGAGPVALLALDDAGPGLAPAMYGRSADDFGRFDRSRSADAGGYGLGLGLVARVVRLHGGTMRLVRSELGGLRTEVRLPLPTGG
jgi:two-component system OmpR family sensor kinase